MMKRLYTLLLAALLPILGLTAQTPRTALWDASPVTKYEVRAVWLTTVMSLDWPQSKDAATQQRELIETLDRLQDAGINTVLFQTRVRATTIYPSKLEPWETCLTGVPGRSPGYDPLQLCIDECHKRGMECHAWVVTIPVGKWQNIGCKELRQRYPSLVKRIGDEGFMDPEKPGTATYLANVCREIVQNYDVDGIHLDYIRYPETWRIKVSRAKGREHITAIVRAINRAVKQEKPWVKMSCSPIGKHDDLTRYRAGGWNARTAVCQDAQMWLREGLMDELFPMMYFQGNNFYPFAVDWQEQSAGRIVVPGLGIYFLDPRESKNWTLDQVERQMHVVRQLGMGHCYFRSKFLTDNVKGIYDFAARFDATPALIPPMTWAGKPVPSAPATITLDGNRLSWEGAVDHSGGSYLLYNIYASKDFPVDVSRAENLVAVRQQETSLLVPARSVTPNSTTVLNFAVTAMDRYGQESEPLQLLLNAGPQYAAPLMARTDGSPVAMPKKGSILDADYMVIETLSGRQVATVPYTEGSLNVDFLPDGMYQLRSLGRKGRNHRMGFFSIRRPDTVQHNRQTH